jgi:antitoxin ParD1/3/4
MIYSYWDCDMSELAKRTISLPAEHNAYIEKKLKSGGYATASEVVREGLRALQARDEAIEHWLRTDVVAAYDELVEHPERAIPAEEAFRMLSERTKAS